MSEDESAGPRVTTEAVGDLPVAVQVTGHTSPLAGGGDTAWSGFTGAAGECCVVLAEGGPELHVGLGPEAHLDSETVHRAARTAGRRLVQDIPADGPDLVVGVRLAADAEGSLGLLPAVGAVTAGLLEGVHSHPAADRLRLHLTELPNDPGVEAAVTEACAMAQAVGLATELVDARANQLTPTSLAARAERLATAYGLEFSCLDEATLQEQGLGALLSVGAGSSEPSCLVRLAYRPEPAGGDASPVALVGKGVTFDSGGLSLKDPSAMVGMHSDMAGAATVLAAMTALRGVGAEAPVVAYLPLAENLPGPGATRPGDVVRSLSGKGIEVVDTDFEGRVLMADALTMAAREHPALVIDVATLTYQAIIALGPEIGAVVGRDAGVAERLQAAGEQVGEAWWPLPYATRYRSQVRSVAPGADVRNHPGADSGRAITAALFLGESVPEGIPWAHLDMAGPAMTGSGLDARATGFGVRTLIRFLSQHSAQATVEETS
ncbi:M17 family metallopeptidase [Ornithinimicrobium cavernae]|uniref:M17 family metallopeptidase n=1 Tax=Ornithinimicrobium cavernae TaxID=2666047 RepID=UPI000D69CD7A|nr:leucyl aminopeptidase family protein [Ornithinimicrobium cavernae]